MCISVNNDWPGDKLASRMSMGISEHKQGGIYGRNVFGRTGFSIDQYWMIGGYFMAMKRFAEWTNARVVRVLTALVAVNAAN